MFAWIVKVINQCGHVTADCRDGGIRICVVVKVNLGRFVGLDSDVVTQGVFHAWCGGAIGLGKIQGAHEQVDMPRVSFVGESALCEGDDSIEDA